METLSAIADGSGILRLTEVLDDLGIVLEVRARYRGRLQQRKIDKHVECVDNKRLEFPQFESVLPMYWAGAGKMPAVRPYFEDKSWQDANGPGPFQVWGSP